MTGPIPERVALRALTKVTAGPGGCLLSTYSVASHGYAQIGWHDDKGNRYVTTAHRAAWVAYTGQQIPSGMTIDHLCRVRRCVNPLHLRLLSNADNAKDNGQVRTSQPTGRLCHEGHDMVAGSTGRTRCRDCFNARRRERRRALNNWR